MCERRLRRERETKGEIVRVTEREIEKVSKRERERKTKRRGVSEKLRWSRRRGGQGRELEGG